MTACFRNSYRIENVCYFSCSIEGWQRFVTFTTHSSFMNTYVRTVTVTFCQFIHSTSFLDFNFQDVHIKKQDFLLPQCVKCDNSLLATLTNTLSPSVWTFSVPCERSSNLKGGPHRSTKRIGISPKYLPLHRLGRFRGGFSVHVSFRLVRTFLKVHAFPEPHPSLFTPQWGVCIDFNNITGTSPVRTFESISKEKMSQRYWGGLSAIWARAEITAGRP